MDTYKAYFRENKKVKTIKMALGTVDRVQKRDGGLVAYVPDPTGTYEHKFWVAKKDQPLGARCKVYLREGDPYPTISRRKSDFLVEAGTAVLLARPHKGSSAFPVISWDEYQETLRKHEPKVQAVDPLTTKKKDHRWVEPPPVREASQGSPTPTVSPRDEYRETPKEHEPKVQTTEPPVTKKGDHRWVEAPPFPKAPNRTPHHD